MSAADLKPLPRQQRRRRGKTRRAEFSRVPEEVGYSIVLTPSLRLQWPTSAENFIIQLYTIAIGNRYYAVVPRARVGARRRVTGAPLA